MSALCNPELAMKNLENRALAYTLLLMGPLLSCSSPREMAYSVQYIALYCYAELNCSMWVAESMGQWGIHR